MLGILLSILAYAAARLVCACLVSVEVSAPYVVAGSTHEFVLILSPDAVVLPREYVAFIIVYLNIVHVDRGVV